MFNTHNSSQEGTRHMKFRIFASVLGAIALFYGVAMSADQAADGQRLVPSPTGATGRIFISRSVDSTGTKAGNRDSAVIISSGRSPVPVFVGGVYIADSTSRGARTDSVGNWKISDASRDRDLWLNTVAIQDSISSQTICDSTLTPVYTAPYGRLFVHLKVTPYTGVTWMRFAIMLEGGNAAALDTNSFVPWVHPVRGVTTDSLNLGLSALGGTTSTVTSQEFEVTVPFTRNVATTTGGINTGAYFEVTDTRGMPWWAPYTKVRVRLIASSLGATSAWTNMTLRLIGRPF